MKNYILIFLIIASIYNASAQPVTIVIKPDPNTGKDAMIFSCAPCGYNSMNFGNVPDLNAIAWTNGGNNSNSRALFEYDLSVIPSSALILDARLSLYYNPSSSEGSHSGNNAATLQRIITSWSENSVTWDLQPQTTIQNQVLLNSTTTNTQNFLNINVTNLVKDMIQNPSQSYGFMLKLQNESPYKKLIFASSDHPSTSLRPSIEITFDTSCTFLVLQPENGKDAMIYSCVACGYAGLNFNNTNDLSAIAWTNGGNPSNARALIEFDLGTIPFNAIVAEAKLSLFHNPFSNEGSHSGINISVLQRITSSWNENSVTWNTQPTTTSQNQIILPATSTSNQDFLNIDVTTLVQDMVSTPGQSHGFMLKLATESIYKKLIFSSSDHPDPARHPKLEICYSLASGIEENLNELISVFPNPASENLNINIPAAGEKIIRIFNTNGQLVENIRTFEKNLNLNTSVISVGMYFLQIETGGKILNRKFIKN